MSYLQDTRFGWEVEKGMLRRALVLTTVLVGLFFLARWAFVDGEASVAATEEAPTGGKVVPAAEPVVPPATAPAEAAPPMPTDVARLLGHRAVYDVKLGRADNGSGVATADGRMVIEFADTCDGYALTQRLEMRLGDGEGSATVTDFRVTNWESTDGRRFRFASRHIVNGQEDQAFEGSAELAADGSGKAHFSKPEEKDAELPAGTVFPTMHTIELIRAAEAHKQLLTRGLFDGSGDDLTYDVTAVIGRFGKSMPASLKGKGAELLADQGSWPVRIAFFSTTKNEELPEYEIGFRLYPNGVAGDMDLDYGDFSLDAVLSSIEALPKPAC